MSRLKLYRETEPLSHEFRVVHDDEPVVLSFQSFARQRILLKRSRFSGSGIHSRLLKRARALRTNDCCPSCHSALVEPLDLSDGIPGRNRQTIPGTSTLVGFHCQRCHWEWPADD